MAHVRQDAEVHKSLSFGCFLGCDGVCVTCRYDACYCKEEKKNDAAHWMFRVEPIISIPYSSVLLREKVDHVGSIYGIIHK